MNNTLPENLIEKNSGFKRITKSSVILQNGEELPVDAIIYSTGYKYSFPFLPEGMVRWDKNRLITHFYKDIIPVEYPSIMFMLMPRLITFYPLADQQARFIASVVSGVCQLPLEGEMKSIQAHEFKNRPIDGDSQWDYDREIAELGHFEPLPVVLKKIWDHYFKIWFSEFVKIRQMSYKITGTDSYTALEQ